MAFAAVLEVAPFPALAEDPLSKQIRLFGSRCRGCGKITFPPYRICSACRCDLVDPVMLSDRGTLYSFSVVRVPARGWTAPYLLGYVDLPEDVRIFAHLDAVSETLELDMPMRLIAAPPGDAEQVEGRPPFVFAPVAAGRGGADA